jgi:hypothetical protein
MGPVGLGLLAARVGATTAGETAATASVAANPVALAAGAVFIQGHEGPDNGMRFWWVTYVLWNNSMSPPGVYVGRSSGWAMTPEEVVNARYDRHDRADEGYGTPKLDKALQSRGEWTPAYWSNYFAIRGREQQLLDSFGGVGAVRPPYWQVGNDIRAVRANHPFGEFFHDESSRRFGEIAPYTGCKAPTGPQGH